MAKDCHTDFQTNQSSVDDTTLTPLPAPVPVRLADSSGGPVVARSSTVLPCLAVPSGSLSGLHLPLFSTNLVSASGQVAASCSCRLLSHQTLLRHQRLGHPSLPRLRGMHSLLLVSGLPRSLPPLPPSPAPPCLPCVEGRQRAAPHSSSFPPMTAPLQNLYMDVWGPARVSGQGGDHYFLLSVFRVWGSRVFVRDTSTDKLSARAIPCVFLGFPPDTRGWQFHHPTLHHVFPSQDVTFDKSVPFYRLFPYRSAPPPPLPLFLAPGPPPVDPLPPQAVGSSVAPGSASGGAVSGGAASGGAEPGGAESEGAGSGGAEPGGEDPGGAEPAVVETGGVEPRGAKSEGAEFGGAEPRGAALTGGPDRALPRLSPKHLREWFVRRARLRSGALGARGAEDTGAGSAGVTIGAGDPGGTAAAGPGGARTKGSGASRTGGVEDVGAGDPTELGAAGAGGTGAGGGRGTVRLRSYIVPLLQQVLGVLSSTGLTPLLCPPPDPSQLPLQQTSPLPAPSPYTEQSGGLTEQREPASRPVSPVRTARRAPRSRPPPIPGTNAMALRPSSVPLRVPLQPFPDSSLLELLLFVATCRLDYATALVAESMSASPLSVRGACALNTDVLEDRQEDFEYLAAAVPRFASMLLAPEGDQDAADIPTPRSYAEAITGPYSS
ncbi:unnamed protein product [Closterium sp. NIES-53]